MTLRRLPPPPVARTADRSVARPHAEGSVLRFLPPAGDDSLDSRGVHRASQGAPHPAPAAAPMPPANLRSPANTPRPTSNMPRSSAGVRTLASDASFTNARPLAQHPVARNPAARVAAETYRWEPDDPRLAAVSEQAWRTIEHGYELARKGAFYSARGEFRAALQTVAEALDARHGVVSHSRALGEALEALAESRDFVGVRSRDGGQAGVHVIAAAHRTPVLLEDEPEVPALLAAQRYLAFAHRRFEAALGGAPVGSAALFALGKVQQLLGDPRGDTGWDAALAATYHKAALAVDPRNYEAANELGVLLARAGQWQEARAALQQSVAVRPSAEAWQNLVVIHQRLGEAELARIAAYQQQLTASGGAGAGTATHFVQWVAPEAFAGAVAGAGGPHGYVAPQAPVPQQPAEMPTQGGAAANTASRTKPGFSWPW